MVLISEWLLKQKVLLLMFQFLAEQCVPQKWFLQKMAKTQVSSNMQGCIGICLCATYSA